MLIISLKSSSLNCHLKKKYNTVLILIKLIYSFSADDNLEVFIKVRFFHYVGFFYYSRCAYQT